MRAERTLLSLVVALLVWLVPTAARADALDIEHDVVSVNGALTIAWCTESSIWIGEWDSFVRTWTSKTKIRDEARCDVSLRLARSRTAMILAIGDATSGAADAHPVEVLRLERTPVGYVETNATKLAAGFAASLVASADAIAVASYEELPRAPEAAALLKPPPSFHKLHVRVLDPRTLAVVSARTLYGHALLRPHQVPAIAGRALAVVDTTLFVGVPDDKPRMATFDLSTLRPTGERVLSIDTSSKSAWFTSVALVRNGTAVTASLDPPVLPAAAKAALATLP